MLLCSTLLLFSCTKEEGPISRPPNSFDLIEVPNGATDIELQPQLKWEVATDPDGDQVTYQVYLDAQNPPQTSIINNLNVNTLTIEDALQPETTYYWKVVAKDTQGNTTESNVASFTTREKTTEEAIVGKWFYESIEGQVPLSDCEKQSFYEFTDKLVFRYQVYDSSCRLYQTVTGTYELMSNNHIQLDLSYATSLYIIEILSLTETTLVLDLDGIIYTCTKE